MQLLICFSIQKATDESLLEKLNQFHKANEFYEVPHKKELAFIIAHYAGKVKYQVKVRVGDEWGGEWVSEQ